MKLQTAQLKEFIALSSLIRQNNITPITKFLKFVPGGVIKTSMNSFLKFRLDCTETFLIEEVHLNNFVQFTDYAEIDVAIGEKTITLSDPKKKINCSAEPVVNFPALSDPAGPKYVLDAGMREAIGVAAQMNDQAANLMALKNHVYIHEETIGGTDGFVMFVKKVPGLAMEAILHTNVADIVGKFDSDCTFQQSDNYQFFTTSRYRFGFVKPEVQPTKLLPATKGESVNGYQCTIDKSPIIKINNFVISSCQTNVLTTELTVEMGQGLIKCVDSKYEIDVVETFTAADGGRLFGTYLPKHFNRLLKALPAERLVVDSPKMKFRLTDEADTFVAILMFSMPNTSTQ